MSAIISGCGLYRYLLTRDIDPSLARVLLFVMLNPSTADATIDDATIKRCVAYARRLGFGRMEVVNLFAYRSTDPKVLRTAGYNVIVGPENDKHIQAAVQRADLVVAAWGVHGGLYDRDVAVQALIRREEKTPHALKMTRWGKPAHPLYLRADLTPTPIAGRFWPKD